MDKTPAPLPLWARIMQRAIAAYVVISLAAGVFVAHSAWTGSLTPEALAAPVQLAQVEGGAANG